ncbi:MAG: hypothetical protein JWO36_5674 [Myxococcales bacterium]|nr:hypothetical protein [Myxococcales bacterium]
MGVAALLASVEDRVSTSGRRSERWGSFHGCFNAVRMALSQPGPMRVHPEMRMPPPKRPSTRRSTRRLPSRPAGPRHRRLHSHPLLRRGQRRPPSRPTPGIPRHHRIRRRCGRGPALHHPLATRVAKKLRRNRSPRRHRHHRPASPCDSVPRRVPRALRRSRRRHRSSPSRRSSSTSWLRVASRRW